MSFDFLSSGDFSDCCGVCTENRNVKKCSACKTVSALSLQPIVSLFRLFFAGNRFVFINNPLENFLACESSRLSFLPASSTFRDRDPPKKCPRSRLCWPFVNTRNETKSIFKHCKKTNMRDIISW